MEEWEVREEWEATNRMLQEVCDQCQWSLGKLLAKLHHELSDPRLFDLAVDAQSGILPDNIREVVKTIVEKARLIDVRLGERDKVRQRLLKLRASRGWWALRRAFAMKCMWAAKKKKLSFDKEEESARTAILKSVRDYKQRILNEENQDVLTFEDDKHDTIINFLEIQADDEEDDEGELDEDGVGDMANIANRSNIDSRSRRHSHQPHQPHKGLSSDVEEAMQRRTGKKLPSANLAHNKALIRSRGNSKKQFSGRKRSSLSSSATRMKRSSNTLSNDVGGKVEEENKQVFAEAMLSLEEAKRLLVESRAALLEEENARVQFVTHDVVEKKRDELHKQEEIARNAQRQAEEMEQEAMSLRVFVEMASGDNGDNGSKRMSVALEEKASRLLSCIAKFEGYLTRGQTTDAMLLAATSPENVLRTPMTWQRFMTMNGGEVWELYARLILIHNPTHVEILQCVQEAIKRRDLAIISHWLTSGLIPKSIQTAQLLTVLAEESHAELKYDAAVLALALIPSKAEQAQMDKMVADEKRKEEEKKQQLKAQYLLQMEKERGYKPSPRVIVEDHESEDSKLLTKKGRGLSTVDASSIKDEDKDESLTEGAKKIRNGEDKEDGEIGEGSGEDGDFKQFEEKVSIPKEKMGLGNRLALMVRNFVTLGRFEQALQLVHSKNIASEEQSLVRMIIVESERTPQAIKNRALRSLSADLNDRMNKVVGELQQMGFSLT
eukprot:m.79776 g.79776  ORF g.79776 m.79776 type:complete len:722 (+) comp11990_c0_seq1:124-2289(+)